MRNIEEVVAKLCSIYYLSAALASQLTASTGDISQPVMCAPSTGDVKVKGAGGKSREGHERKTRKEHVDDLNRDLTTFSEANSTLENNVCCCSLMNIAAHICVQDECSLLSFVIFTTVEDSSM